MLWDSKAGACGWEWLMHEQWGKAADLIRQRLPKEMTLELAPEGQEGSVQVTFQAELQLSPHWSHELVFWGFCNDSGIVMTQLLSLLWWLCPESHWVWGPVLVFLKFLHIVQYHLYWQGSSYCPSSKAKIGMHVWVAELVLFLVKHSALSPESIMGGRFTCQPWWSKAYLYDDIFSSFGLY